MNTGKALTFILLSSGIMMTALLLQSAFAPPQPNPADGAAVAQNDVPGDNPNVIVDPAALDQESVDQENVDQENVEGSPTADSLEKSSDQPAGDEIANPDTPAEETSTELISDDATEDSSTEKESAEDAKPVSTRIAKDDFVTMGSLGLGGEDRYLVTANKRGGTIRRIELNFRHPTKKDRRYKYRDMVWEGGYLGELDCLNVDDGCEVRVVGKGTPAQLAGVAVGDVIVSLNGEPVVNVSDFQTILEETTDAGDEIQLGIKRNGSAQTLAVELTTKPIELVRPEPDWVDPNFDYPESFVFSLVKPHDQPEKAWPDLDSEMRDSNWELVDTGNPNEIEFRFDLTEEKLAKHGIKGPLVVRKRYRLPTLAEDDILNLRSRTFHITFELEVENKSDSPQDLAFELDGPTGIPAETWWYGYKIHGRQTAIGSIGGARDIVGSTKADPYVFFGCPEIVSGANAKKGKKKKLYFLCDYKASDPDERQLNWAGVDAHYFNVALIPDVPEGEGFTTNSVTAYLNSRNGVTAEIPKNVRVQKLMDVTFQMTAPMQIGAGQTYKQSFDIFCGPKEAKTLEQYGLDDVRTFGWFSWCSYVLLWFLHGFYWITGSFSYGLAIIMLTVLVRCCMIPFSRKAALNAQMMQHLAPQMKEITEKHKDNMEKRAAAQRELYKKYNFNPLGGCSMMFFQIPIFYGLYKALNVDIALRDQPLLPGLNWCTNLAAPDRLLYWKDWMPFGLGEEASWLGPYFNLLPILTMFLFLAQQKLFTPPPTDDQQKMMQKMMTFMMIAMGVMFFKVPSGLCLYFITSSLWAVIERKLLPKPVLDTEKVAGLDDLSPKEAKKFNQKKQMEDDKRSAESEERRQRNLERKKRLKQRGQ